MTPTEAAGLLAVAAAFDNRKPDADAATAWSMALEGLRFEDCRTAIVEHFKGSSDWLMPADVRRGVKRLREARLLAFGGLPEPPRDLDDRELQAWYRDTSRAIADGVLTERPPEPKVLEPAAASAALASLRAGMSERSGIGRPTLDPAETADLTPTPSRPQVGSETKENAHG